ncbi:MAG: cation:proton antiporter [Candidatus Odinarchaeia archaeon]
MSAEAFLLALGLGLVVSKLLGELFERIGFPSVVGMIIAGIILGPTVFNIIQPETIAEFAQIGIIFLLFIIGMEIDFKELKKISNNAIIITGVGVAVSFAFGFFGAHLFGLAAVDWRAPIFMGVAFMATSIGITAKTLHDMGKLHTPEGKTVLSVAIYDDVITLIVLTAVVAVLGESPGTDFTFIITIIGVVVFFIVMIFLMPLAIKLIPKFAKTAISSEIILALVVGVILLVGFVSSTIGLSAILGAFLLGLAFRNIPEISRVVHDKVRTVTDGIFLPIFFFYIGVLTIIGPEILTIATLGLISFAIISKILGTYIGGKAVKLKNKPALIVGIGMVPRAEVLLAVTEAAVLLGVFLPQTITIMVLIVLVTSILTPILLKLSYRKDLKKPPQATTSGTESPPPDINGNKSEEKKTLELQDDAMV